VVGDKGSGGDKGTVGDKGEIGDKGITGDKGTVGDKGTFIAYHSFVTNRSFISVCAWKTYGKKTYIQYNEKNHFVFLLMLPLRTLIQNS
jgi:hypothetical protein